MRTDEVPEWQHELSILLAGLSTDADGLGMAVAMLMEECYHRLGLEGAQNVFAAAVLATADD